MSTIIGINGAAGRMGQRLIHLAGEDRDLTLGAALEAPGPLRLCLSVPFDPPELVAAQLFDLIVEHAGPYRNPHDG